MNTINNPLVQEKFSLYPKAYQKKLLQLRELIYSTAYQLDNNLEVTESLKWGQPSYTVKGGTPIRIDVFDDNQVAMFFHCQTNLVSYFRTVFDDKLTFSGNRAIILDINEPLPVANITFCIESALLYHKKKNG
ncbi:DUF1801 domain-containing protein [Culicoidibacter larvae]|uniref:DUF1801 domain-containing protein n=1 Tax=Culicoidibacter larvae TaxID=2579976 RepID=A0A5R8QCK9_9FIRM|nr:DUF1801 domain-containing protein [Culicoidibacter larvae]TLG74311.1 DUF1801 domain-containing protein [Culicoidibacter larvae]